MPAPDAGAGRAAGEAAIGASKTVTGPCHECKHELALRARYDSGRPMAGAPFTARFQDGSAVSGTLDGNGEAIVTDAPAGAAVVERGEEPAPYTPAEAPANPDYQRDIEPDRLRAELARVQAELRRKEAEGVPVMGRTSGETLRLRRRRDELIQTLDGTSDAGGTLSWIWGTLAGEFNEDPSAGQILVNTMLTMVPVVDQIADLRDMLAIVIRLMDPPARAKTANWVTLALTLVGLIPTVGSALKGVAKLAYQFGPQAAKADELLRVLRYFGAGDAMTWLREQLGQWDAHKRHVIATFEDMCDGVIKALTDIPLVETQPTIDAVKAIKGEAADRLAAAMDEIAKPLRQFVDTFKVKKTATTTPEGSKNYQPAGDSGTPSNASSAESTAVPPGGTAADGAATAHRRAPDEGQIDTAIARTNANGEDPTAEVLGELGRQMYMDATNMRTDPRYVPRTHGPDDLARNSDGQLVGVEAKGNNDGNIALPRDRDQHRQVSHASNQKRAETLLEKKRKGKVGVPSRRKGGAYTESEMELYEEIDNAKGNKRLISTHTNTQTGTVRVIERDAMGRPIGEEGFKIENINGLERRVKEKMGIPQ